MGPAHCQISHSEREWDAWNKLCTSDAVLYISWDKIWQSLPRLSFKQGNVMWIHANPTTLNINRQGPLRGEEMYVGEWCKRGTLKLVLLSKEASAGVDRWFWGSLTIPKSIGADGQLDFCGQWPFFLPLSSPQCHTVPRWRAADSQWATRWCGKYAGHYPSKRRRSIWTGTESLGCFKLVACKTGPRHYVTFQGKKLFFFFFF